MTQLIFHIACYLVTKLLYATLDHLKVQLYCYYFLILIVSVCSYYYCIQ